MSHVIAIFNQKGGVGKTTTATNLAACLGAFGHPTLLVDVDPQANASSACGLDVNNLETTIYDSLLDGQTPVPYSLDHVYQGLSVLPASIDLSGAELELLESERREFHLKDVIGRLNGAFEYVIIDCPPSLGLLAVNSMVAADWVIVPVQAEYLALEGLSRMVHTIDRIHNGLNPNLQLLGILTTMYDGRTNLANQVIAEIRRAFGDKVFQTQVTRSVRLSEAPSHGKPIIYYDSRSPGAFQYVQFSEEVLHACEKARSGSGA